MTSCQVVFRKLCPTHTRMQYLGEVVVIDVHPVLSVLLGKVIGGTCEVVVTDHIADHFLVEEPVFYVIPVGVLKWMVEGGRGRGKKADVRLTYPHEITVSFGAARNKRTALCFDDSDDHFTWNTMASRSSCVHDLKIVSTMSRNFSRSKTLGSSFLKY